MQTVFAINNFCFFLKYIITSSTKKSFRKEPQGIWPSIFGCTPKPYSDVLRNYDIQELKISSKCVDISFCKRTIDVIYFSPKSLNKINQVTYNTTLNIQIKYDHPILMIPCIQVHAYETFFFYKNSEAKKEKSCLIWILHYGSLHCYILISGLQQTYILVTVCQWSGRPGFNPRLHHTKNIKNGTWYLLA